MIPEELTQIRELQVAIAAARLGGDVLLRYFCNDIEIRDKAINDLVTNADIESEEIITSYILEHFPEHNFLAEEGHNDISSQSRGDDLWIIDPLDGTTNFAHGLPHFATSIAFYRDGTPFCGVVFNPVRDEMYLAVKGQGAYFQGARITVCPQTELSECLVGVGFYYDRGEMMKATLATVESLFSSQIRGIRRFGTAALDLCMVAQGRYGAYFEYQLSPWDFAAGRLIVEEAGGSVTTATGSPLPIQKSTLLASNKHLHPQMIALIEKSAGAFLRNTSSE